jgi:hypothetical protein
MSQPAPAHGQAARFRPRRLAIPNGETLVMSGDGTIERRDATGTAVERWATDDPAWAGMAIRFGVRAFPETVVPRGRDVPGSKPPA